MRKGSSSKGHETLHVSGFALNTGLKVGSPIKAVAFLTRGGFAYRRVLRAELETLHAQTVEAAVCVDATLSAGIGGRALVYVDASLPIIFQTEAMVASALWKGKTQRR